MHDQGHSSPHLGIRCNVTSLRVTGVRLEGTTTLLMILVGTEAAPTAAIHMVNVMQVAAGFGIRQRHARAVRLLGFFLLARPRAVRLLGFLQLPREYGSFGAATTRSIFLPATRSPVRRVRDQQYRRMGCADAVGSGRGRGTSS